MEFFLQQTFSGLAFGGVYACMALAVVMIYQATDHLNFAQGEMAMFSTYIAFTLLSHGVPYWWTFLLAMAISFLGGVLIERVIVRPVEGTSVLNEVIVFIGLLTIFNSLAGWIWDYTIKPFPSPFPKEPLFGNNFVGTHDLGVIGVTLVVLFGVFLFFRYTPIGLAMRAAAQDPASARLVGIRVGWMLALGWGLAAAGGAGGGKRGWSRRSCSSSRT
jgi:branched-chain amino acid transport system permease protein